MAACLLATSVWWDRVVHHHVELNLLIYFSSATFISLTIIKVTDCNFGFVLKILELKVYAINSVNTKDLNSGLLHNVTMLSVALFSVCVAVLMCKY
jgi:hypothetical protein